MAYYLKQILSSNRIKMDKFYSKNRKLELRFGESTATYASFQQAQAERYIAKRMFGGIWEIRRREGRVDCLVRREEDIPTIGQIERDVMSGRHVSPHNLNRLMRSPRGQMMMASLHR